MSGESIEISISLRGDPAVQGFVMLQLFFKNDYVSIKGEQEL